MPDRQFVLVESDKRKAVFLRQTASALGLPVQVLPHRIEELSKLPSSVISARALAPLDHLLVYAHRHLVSNTVCLFPKGESYENEVKHAEQKWRFDLVREPSRTSAGSAVLVIKNVQNVKS